MDGEILALIISGATLIGGAIGWLVSQYWQRRNAMRQAAREANEILIEKKTSLEQGISKIENPSNKEKLLAQLAEVNHAIWGLHSHRLQRTLRDAGLPSEETLIADGRSWLQPQQVTLLKEITAEIGALSTFLSTEDLLVLGKAYYHMEQYQDAKDVYDKIIDLNPNFPAALANRGVIYIHMERYDEAIVDYAHALELRPDDPGILYNRGTAYVRLGRYDEALADYNRSLELRPNHPGTLNNRGNTHTKLERYGEALADFNHALELSPDNPDTLFNLVCLFSLEGKTDDALAYLERAIEKDKEYYKIARTDTDLDNIRDDPRFKKLIELD